jgi:aminoglycoside 3-N-acetyltransferase
MNRTTEVTASDITRALRSLGVGAGDLLAVHSSLSSFGRVDGGARAVAQALVDSVSPGGSVFVPTFNYGQLAFDPAATPSLAGAITEAFRQLPGVVRSGQPTHPWAGMGPDAPDILDGHERATPFGPGSPVWKLWERNAWVLLMGVDHRANSMIHVAEELERLPYLEQTRVAKVLREGQIIEQIVRRPGHSAGFNKLDAPLRAADQVRNTMVGRAKLMLIRAADIVARARAMLQHDPAALLCDDTACERCAEARRIYAFRRRRRDAQSNKPSGPSAPGSGSDNSDSS